MKFRKRESCPICQSKNIALFKTGTFNPEKIISQDFRITDSKYGSIWTLYICRNCTFVFSNPYLEEMAAVNFYSELQDEEYIAEAEGRIKNFKNILQRLKKIEKPGNRLLDIGAASGIFLNLCRQAGFEIFGIEPSTYLVNQAKENYRLNLFKGTIADFKSKQKFAIITLIDLIEHLVDPDDFMTKITPLMERNGIIIIVTPDISSMTARIFGNRWWHYRIAHLNFFNLKSINVLLEKHGYRIILKKRYTWNFSLFYLTTRIFSSLKSKRSLQKILKKINFKLQLFDSWEIYARKI